MRHLVFAALVLLACLEKLAAVANVVAIERDWVIIVADTYDMPRRELNASLRRIDLLSKLVSPLFVSALDGYSASLAIWVVMAINVTTVFVESDAASKIYAGVPSLSDGPSQAKNEAEDFELQAFMSPASPTTVTPSESGLRTSRSLRSVAPWVDYLYSPVFLASFSNAILYWTVLSFGGQMTTYLLSIGFVPLEISILRLVSVLAELGGTWIAPYLMSRIGPVRAGLWFLMWQVSCVGVFAVSIFSREAASRAAGTLLAVGITFKRLGLWGSDLAIQLIVQEATPPSSRAQFSSTEMAIQNLFEMLSSATTAIFSRPDEFRYPVLISYAAIVASTLCYAGFVKRSRGHLLHVPALR